MATYKKTSRKTGPNSRQTTTIRSNGTVRTSTSNKSSNTTTNISSKGVRQTTNNNGWVKTTFIPAFPKPNPKSRIKSNERRNRAAFNALSKCLSGLFSSNKTKPVKKEKDCVKVDSPQQTTQSSTFNPDTEFTGKETLAIITFVIIVCAIIQLFIM